MRAAMLMLVYGLFAVTAYLAGLATAIPAEAGHIVEDFDGNIPAGAVCDEPIVGGDGHVSGEYDFAIFQEFKGSTFPTWIIVFTHGEDIFINPDDFAGGRSGWDRLTKCKLPKTPSTTSSTMPTTTSTSTPDSTTTTAPTTTSSSVPSSTTSTLPEPTSSTTTPSPTSTDPPTTTTEPPPVGAPPAGGGAMADANVFLNLLGIGTMVVGVLMLTAAGIAAWRNKSD